MRLRTGLCAQDVPSRAQTRCGCCERARARDGGRRACARRWSGASTPRALLCRRQAGRGQRACTRTKHSRSARAAWARARRGRCCHAYSKVGEGRIRDRRLRKRRRRWRSVRARAHGRSSGACARSLPRQERCNWRRRTKVGAGALALTTLGDAPALEPVGANAPAGVADPLRRRLRPAPAACPPGAPLRHVYPVA